ncbi:MAG: tail protein X [Rhizobiales bacterium]|nr:tail protein X [Hyphomicrobiales bacterium]
MTLQENKIYITIDGEQLFQIISRHYKCEDTQLSELYNLVMNNNRGLAAIKQPFKAGLKIILPSKPEAAKTQQVALW